MKRRNPTLVSFLQEMLWMEADAHKAALAEAETDDG